MTPKEKAKELLESFAETIPGIITHDDGHTQLLERDWESAKQCALICVDEMLAVLPPVGMVWQAEGMHDYWQEVKTELINL